MCLVLFDSIAHTTHGTLSFSSSSEDSLIPFVIACRPFLAIAALDTLDTFDGFVDFDFFPLATFFRGIPFMTDADDNEPDDFGKCIEIKIRDIIFLGHNIGMMILN